jgi:hypothetical protein
LLSLSNNFLLSNDSTVTTEIPHLTLYRTSLFHTGVLISPYPDQEGDCSPEITTHKKLAYLGFQCLDHPTYSPDLAPSDYHLFPGLQKQLKGK